MLQQTKLSILCIFSSLTAVLADNPKVNYIELTDSSTHAGNRNSRSNLKIVQRDSISVGAVANVTEGSPEWQASSGSIDGSGTSVTWTGSDNSTITATLPDGSGSADIEKVVENQNGGQIDLSKFTPWITKINEIITTVSETSFNPQLSTEFAWTNKNVDFYSKGEETGIYYKTKTKLELKMSEPIRTRPLTISIVPGIVLEGKGELGPITIGIEGELTYDESKQTPTGPENKMTASASLPLKGTVSLGEGVTGDQARGLVISGSASSTFGVNCEFSIKDKKVIASGTCDLGKLELSGEVSIKITDDLTWKLKQWGPKPIAAATLTKQIGESVFLDFSGS